MASRGWLVKRLEDRGEAECGLRVIEGEHPGLVPRWRHGRAHLAPGRITFRPYLPPGTRVFNPFADRVVIDVKSVSELPREKHGVSDAWSLNPGALVFRVRTATAAVEWAVVGRQLEWVLEQVLPER